MNEISALLDKAARSFASAERLLEGGDADFVVSRAYYGYFYVVEALLLSKDLTFSRHSQVISQYGLHFAKDEILALRQTADYSTEPAPEPEKVRELISVGEDFLRDGREHLRRKPFGSPWLPKCRCARC